MSNTCQCPDPPGGSVRCPSDSFAYCYVNQGKLKSGCYKPVRSSINRLGSAEAVFFRHIISVTPAKYRIELTGAISQFQESAFFESSDGNFRITFSRPGSRGAGFNVN